MDIGIGVLLQMEGSVTQKIVASLKSGRTTRILIQPLSSVHLFTKYLLINLWMPGMLLNIDGYAIVQYMYS